MLEIMRRTALDRELRLELGSLAHKAAIENDCHTAARSFVDYIEAIEGPSES